MDNFNANLNRTSFHPISSPQQRRERLVVTPFRYPNAPSTNPQWFWVLSHPRGGTALARRVPFSCGATQSSHTQQASNTAESQFVTARITAFNPFAVQCGVEGNTTHPSQPVLIVFSSHIGRRICFRIVLIVKHGWDWFDGRAWGKKEKKKSGLPDEPASQRTI